MWPEPSLAPGFAVRDADGDDSVDAVADLKEQLEDLYTELQTDDNYSQEMLATKAFLARLLVPGAASHAAV